MQKVIYGWAWLQTLLEEFTGMAATLVREWDGKRMGDQFSGPITVILCICLFENHCSCCCCVVTDHYHMSSYDVMRQLYYSAYDLEMFIKWVAL